jgi:hypothetical protein
MKTQKYPNLTPWQPGQSGNPAGRKLGSKNMSTIVKELLEQDTTSDILAQNDLTQFTQNTSTTYAKAIVWATINKAMQGNMQAVLWLAEHQERNATNETIHQEPVIISTIIPRTISTVD